MQISDSENEIIITLKDDEELYVIRFNEDGTERMYRDVLDAHTIQIVRRKNE